LTSSAARAETWPWPGDIPCWPLLTSPQSAASEDCVGYDYKRERFLEHYLRGRDWQEEWEKSDTKDRNGRFYDSRGSAPKWWERRAR